MNILTKKEAREKGLPNYFTGRPCSRGHLVGRSVQSGMCRLCDKEDQAAYKERNKERVLEADRARYNATKEEKRDRMREQYKKTYQRHKASFIAAVRVRRGQMIHRTPAWSQKEAIRSFYNNCPQGYEVDHIIPLQGKLVSGLHVLENLQYLPVAENRSKGNRYVA